MDRDERDVNIPDQPKLMTWADAASKNWKITQNWTWHEVWNWTLEVNENIKISESCKKDNSKSLSESFSFVEKSPVFNAEKVSLEYFHFAENISERNGFNRDFYETVSFVEHKSNGVSIEHKDSFGIFDTLVRDAQGVFSDILFEEGEWTLEEMQKYILKGKHVGFENFKPFVYGDYTYQNALFRVSITSETKDRGSLEQFQIAVDVPDIVDRGSGEVEDENFDLVIEFNKKFHIAPEVTITMRAGVSSVPVVANISDITETNFKVHLLNALTGERTTGRFIWTAVGY